MSALRQAIDKVGGVAECARICGITRRGVYKWLHRGSLPRTEYTGETRHAQRMAAASAGAFTAEWLLEHARPAVGSQQKPAEHETAPQQPGLTGIQVYRQKGERMSKQHDIPDYKTWARDDLITETTRQAFVIDAEEQAGNATQALLARERYHLAMAALICQSAPFDAAAIKRRVSTHHEHARRAEECRRQRLGLSKEVPA